MIIMEVEGIYLAKPELLDVPVPWRRIEVQARAL